LLQRIFDAAILFIATAYILGRESRAGRNGGVHRRLIDRGPAQTVSAKALIAKWA
jgi:hypothetical protein